LEKESSKKKMEWWVKSRINGRNALLAPSTLLMELHIEDENSFQNNLTVFPEKFHKQLREVSGYIVSSNEGK
jgi:hypothetical protein